jgi:hypothetical protein
MSALNKPAATVFDNIRGLQSGQHPDAKFLQLGGRGTEAAGLIAQARYDD